MYNKQTKLLLLYFVNHLFHIFEDSRYPYRYEIMDAAASKFIYRLGDCKKIAVIIFVVKVAHTQTNVKLWFTTPNFANWQIFTEQIFTVASVTINSVKFTLCEYFHVYGGYLTMRNALQHSGHGLISQYSSYAYIWT